MSDYMDIPSVTPIAAFIAGIVSVASPCVLPLIPAIFAYSTEKGKLRPVAIVLGLSITFTLMGIVTSAFGSTFRAYLGYLNIIAEIFIIGFGVAMLFELNVFNVFGRLSSLRTNKEERLLGGLLLGMSLGIIWIPCVGPILGTILTMVAVSADITYGAMMLFVYSLGFAIPMLIIAYSANISSAKLGGIAKYDVIIKRAAGAVLIAVGLWMVYKNHLVMIL
ncbi:MAG: cytochrome c biogenesis CcdA family protein [Methanosarcinaceae archaeon]|nr:cytochrome c biogenesis CcdA family protein [Methanosarcinaceae archaeon]